ncbi:MAG: hypothetical protein V3V08_22700 [Nannocystaceae bacterium]
MAATVGAFAGCHLAGATTPVGLGTIGAASADMQPGLPTAVSPLDLEAVSERGRLLCQLERLLGLAYEVGLPRVGAVGAEVLLPVASVDRGGRSGDVTFFRWQSGEAADALGTPDPLLATRWLVVPILLDPDRVLENEQFSDSIEKGSETHLRLVGFVRAAQAAQALDPAGSWSMHPVREYVRNGTKRARQTRVYMFARSEGAPDLEIVVADRKRRTPAVATSVVEQHPAGAYAAAELSLSVPQPGPMTVCRALRRGPAGADVVVRTTQGLRWRIDGGDGRIERLPAHPSSTR